MRSQLGPDAANSSTHSHTHTRTHSLTHKHTLAIHPAEPTRTYGAQCPRHLKKNPRKYTNKKY